MKNALKKSALCLAVTAALAVVPAQANETSTSVRGTISALSGGSIANATITIIHEPSGTVKEVQANEQGIYRVRGLRVGGPYKIIVSSDKYQGKVFENIYLELNEPFDLNAELLAQANMETITVTGSNVIFSNAGSSSVYTSDDINNGTIFNRDLKDIVRSNPLAVVDPTGTELSIAGTNPKYNSLNVDGVAVNDSFGLNANGYPAQRPPVSISAIDQVSIDYAPFTARAAQFTGGQVNVVTKSGTNELRGDVFYEYVPFIGDAYDDVEDIEYDDLENDEITFGASLGGAIVQDKLFYFVSYEEWSKDIVSNYNLNTLEGHRVTTAEVDQVLNILNTVYGIQDSIGSAPPADSDKKILVKLDWNINDAHRADMTYSFQENKAARNYTDGDGTVNLASNFWSQDSETTLLTGHLFSDWTDEFSTEVNFKYKDYTQASNTSSNLGEINVRTAAGTIVAGQDENRHGNELANESTSIAVHGLYLADYMEYKFGIEIENLTNYNLYARHAAGTWSFDSIQEFEDKMAASVSYQNAYTNNMQDLAFDVDSTRYALYGEVNTELFDDFIVTAGVRYEMLSVDGSPQRNPNFENTYGYTNTENMDGVDIFLPRVGFTWDVSEDLTVRGGIGRFSGGMPLVWVSNAYTNDGITLTSAPSSARNEVLGNPSAVSFDTVPQALQDSLSQGDGSTNTIAKGFELPSDWRYQLAADLVFDIPGLGNDFQWVNEFTYVDRQDAPYWIDLSRVKVGETVEGRTIWENRYGEDRWDLELTNIDDGGRSIIFTTALNKNWDNGVSMNLSYTNQDITEVNPGTSSTATSNFQYEVTTNRNSPELGRAYYEIEHRFVLNLGYKTEFVDGYQTSFNMFWERRSGRPFSWTLGAFRDNDLGDQAYFDDSDIYLPYLPASASDPAFDFAGGLSYDEIMAIASQAGVAGYAGDYIPKYIGNQPWLTTIDLAVTQDLPGFAEGHKGQVYFIVDNFANLLNDDWGKSYKMQFPQQILFDYDVNADGQYVLSERFGGTNTQNFDMLEVEQSTWRIKVGVKYSF